MGVKINPNIAPRIISVPSSDGTEITMQQLVTQTRDWEDEPASLSYPYIMKASGKEDLGGGVTVGITTQLQNAKLAFEQRGTSISAGSITTIDTNGITLIDSGATFITDGVIPGASVINITDQSVGTVLSVDSETQLTLLYKLEDGTDNQWDSADVYKIWNIIQCEASGGNLTAVDTGGSTIPAIFPTFGTQIIRTSSSSATLQQLAALEFASFQNAICIDADNITGNAMPGIGGPGNLIGTRQTPSNNLTDTEGIGILRGLSTVNVLGDLTVTNVASWERYDFVGESAIKTTITVNADANVTNCEFYECTLTGTLDGNSQVERSVINSLNFVDGFIHKCSIGTGGIQLGTSTIANLLTCYSGGTTTDPVIDMNGTGILILRDYHGGIKLTNYSGAGTHSIDLSSGHLILDSGTITGGVFIVHGIGKLLDENGNDIFSGTWNGGVTIVNELVTQIAEEGRDYSRTASQLSA